MPVLEHCIEELPDFDDFLFVARRNFGEDMTIDNAGEVLVSELRDHVVERVQALTEGMQTPKARSVNLELDFQFTEYCG
ncbi:MAG: hypothetical protein ACI8TQ_003155 [Planctomycetota bacterium]